MQEEGVRKLWKVYYYAAVNSMTGPLMFKLMTGTKGQGEEDLDLTEYQVGSQAASPAGCGALDKKEKT
jgi:hypothetical protein